MPKPAIVLLSGGLDSATVLAVAKLEGFSICALTIRYGQRHEFEIEAAKRIAERAHVQRHEIAEIDLRSVGGSALTDDIEVPKNRSGKEIGTGVPITYVPARNTIFLSYALAWAEATQAADVFIGVNALDYSGYPDCRPNFIAAFEKMANLATKAAVEAGQKITIHTPLIDLSKADIIKKGLELGVDYSLTHTCYDPSLEGAACGQCDACLLRLKGFEENGIPDPVAYQVQDEPMR